MKTFFTVSFTGYAKYGLILLKFLTVFMLTSCSSSSSDSPTTFTPVNTLEGKVFILGSQIDGASGDLLLYVNGTDINGNVLTVTDLKTTTVSVGSTAYTDGDGSLTIEAVSDSDNFLSLSLVTDYSNSTNGELEFVDGIYTELLNNLPEVFEAQIITFSDEHELQQDWTSSLSDLLLVVDPATEVGAHSVRNKTALYDSMHYALEADAGDLTDGLIDRCRPAHIMVVFTDGDDNESSLITSPVDLQTIVNADKTVSIMLGTSDAKLDVLQTLAGDHGAVVQVVDPTTLENEVDKWVSSLQNIVKMTLAVDVSGESVSITIGSQTEIVVSPLELLCTPL